MFMLCIMQKRVDAGSASIELKLTLSQLYLTEGSVYLACDILRDLGGLSHKPGVVSIRAYKVLKILEVIRVKQLLDLGLFITQICIVAFYMSLNKTSSYFHFIASGINACDAVSQSRRYGDGRGSIGGGRGEVQEKCCKYLIIVS